MFFKLDLILLIKGLVFDDRDAFNELLLRI